MPYEIKPTCPHCKKQLTIKLNIVDKLQARVKELEKRLKENDGLRILKDIFKQLLTQNAVYGLLITAHNPVYMHEQSGKPVKQY